MTRALCRRLLALERRNFVHVSTPHVIVVSGEPWRMVGRGLLVPPQMSVGEWEAVIPAEQARLQARPRTQVIQ